MNETDPQTSQSNHHDSEEWKSCPPEIFLPVLLHELRTPVMAIGSWVQILSNENAKDLHLKAVKGMSRSVERLEDLYQGIANFYQELIKNPI